MFEQQPYATHVPSGLVPVLYAFVMSSTPDRDARLGLLWVEATCGWAKMVWQSADPGLGAPHVFLRAGLSDLDGVNTGQLLHVLGTGPVVDLPGRASPCLAGLVPAAAFSHSQSCRFGIVNPPWQRCLFLRRSGRAADPAGRLLRGLAEPLLVQHLSRLSYRPH